MYAVRIRTNNVTFNVECGNFEFTDGENFLSTTFIDKFYYKNYCTVINLNSVHLVQQFL